MQIWLKIWETCVTKARDVTPTCPSSRSSAMLGSWFASKPDDEKITDPSRRSAEAPAGTNPFQSSTVDPADPTIEPLRRSITAALSTPHDAVLAELHGHYPDLETSARIDGDDVPGLLTHDAGDGNNVNVNEYAGHGPSSGLAGLPHSFLTNFAEAKAGEEILHDPFEGKSLGTLVPPNPILRPEAHTNLSEAARKNEELWTHLSRVLELQSKVATMHVEMEGIRGRPGEGKGKGGLKTGRSWEEGMGMGVRSRATSMAGGGGGEDEGVGVEGDEEAEKNKAREEEFANLAEKFEGTKDSINDIMSTVRFQPLLSTTPTLTLRNLIASNFCYIHSWMTYQKP